MDYARIRTFSEENKTAAPKMRIFVISMYTNLVEISNTPWQPVFLAADKMNLSTCQ